MAQARSPLEVLSFCQDVSSAHACTVAHLPLSAHLPICARFGEIQRVLTSSRPLRANRRASLSPNPVSARFGSWIDGRGRRKAPCMPVCLEQLDEDRRVGPSALQTVSVIFVIPGMGFL